MNALISVAVRLLLLLSISFVIFRVKVRAEMEFVNKILNVKMTSRPTLILFAEIKTQPHVR